ncbi:hypothetical protein CerSpe_256930 [Prunus speciosa]
MKRIRDKYGEIGSNPSDDFKCGLLERNPYEWKFRNRGASGTEFEGMAYHLRIQLTENGRFKIKTKTRERCSVLNNNVINAIVVGNNPSVYCVLTQTESDRRVIPEDNCNRVNSAVKRIRDKFNEIGSNPSDDFKCGLLERNPYEWNFRIRGASGTEFEGMLYYVRIQLTENGRFKIKIRARNRIEDGIGSVVNDNVINAINEIREYRLGKASPVPLQLSPSQASKEREHSQNDSTGGRSVVYNNITGNIIYAAGSEGVGISVSNCMHDPMKEIRFWVLVNTCLVLFCTFLVVFNTLMVLKAKLDVWEEDQE